MQFKNLDPEEVVKYAVDEFEILKEKYSGTSNNYLVFWDNMFDLIGDHIADLEAEDE